MPPDGAIAVNLLYKPPQIEAFYTLDLGLIMADNNIPENALTTPEGRTPSTVEQPSIAHVIPMKKPRKITFGSRRGIPPPPQRPAGCSTIEVPPEFCEETLESYLLDELTNPATDRVSF